MAGANSKAALAFGDEEAAAETLSALSAKPLVLAACLYRQQGTLFAAYKRPGRAHRLSGCGADRRDDVFPGDRMTTTHVGRAPAAAARNALPGGRSPAAPRPPSLVHRPHGDCARGLLFRRRRDGDAAAADDLRPDRRLADAMRTVKAEQRFDIRAAKSPGRRGRDPDRRLQRHALGGRGPRPEAAAAPGASRGAGGERGPRSCGS